MTKSKKVCRRGKRTAEVRRLILRGLPHEEAAKQLHVSCNTIKDHVQVVFREAGVSSRYELAAQEIMKLESQLRILRAEQAAAMADVVKDYDYVFDPGYPFIGSRVIPDDLDSQPAPLDAPAVREFTKQDDVTKRPTYVQPTAIEQTPTGLIHRLRG